MKRKSNISSRNIAVRGLYLPEGGEKILDYEHLSLKSCDLTHIASICNSLGVSSLIYL